MDASEDYAVQNNQQTFDTHLPREQHAHQQKCSSYHSDSAAICTAKHNSGEQQSGVRIYDILFLVYFLRKVLTFTHLHLNIFIALLYLLFYAFPFHKKAHGLPGFPSSARPTHDSVHRLG